MKKTGGTKMEGWLEYDSRHSIYRAKERMGISEKRAIRMFDLARRRGIRSIDCKWSVDRRFLEIKSSEEVEAIAFNGYCFILDRMTMNCITMFPLPKDFGKKKTYYQNNKELKHKGNLWDKEYAIV